MFKKSQLNNVHVNLGESWIRYILETTGIYLWTGDYI